MTNKDSDHPGQPSTPFTVCQIKTLIILGSRPLRSLCAKYRLGSSWTAVHSFHCVPNKVSDHPGQPSTPITVCQIKTRIILGSRPLQTLYAKYRLGSSWAAVHSDHCVPNKDSDYPRQPSTPITVCQIKTRIILGSRPLRSLCAK